ncbi:DUF1643 domain-containing protein [Luteibacter sp. NPDC031894]|uniref:DUF1643 domain-containing protein n=1 Tax=Luteibacter sp. NPDC031894 TaxID=3390572 RepID=UPI003CFE925C
MTAILSPCGQYRYALTRTWDEALPVLVFCMLNPSTADASQDDPTIRRCIGFAKREDCGGLAVVNLFAWRATHPDHMPILDIDKTGPDNHHHVAEVVRGRRVVVAYGAHHAAHPFVVTPLLEVLRQHATSLHHLGTTKAGAPRHPLYVRGDAPLVEF